MVVRTDVLVVKLEKRLKMVEWVEQDKRKRDTGARIGTMHIVLSTYVI